MGQTIEINKTTTVGDLLVVDTDRSISGQNGRSFSVDDDLGPRPDGKLGPGDFDVQLARRLFDSDPAVDHVHVLSNVVTIRRAGGWDETTATAASDVVSGFFRIY